MQLREKNSFGDATLQMNHFPQLSKAYCWTAITPLKSRKPARWQGLDFLMKFPVQVCFQISEEPHLLQKLLVSSL